MPAIIPALKKRPQLFDLPADPHEHRNLAAHNPEVVARLAKKIQNWWPVTARRVITAWTDEPADWQ